jgi:hypothetical protein
MSSISLLAFLPIEFLPLVLIGAGFALILGAKTVAKSLFLLTGVMIILPIILEPLLMLLPEWVLWLLIVFVWLSVFGSISALVLGKGASDAMVGILASDFVKWLLFAPFRAIGWLFRALRP